LGARYVCHLGREWGKKNEVSLLRKEEGIWRGGPNGGGRQLVRGVFKEEWVATTNSDGKQGHTKEKDSSTVINNLTGGGGDST